MIFHCSSKNGHSTMFFSTFSPSTTMMLPPKHGNRRYGVFSYTHQIPRPPTLLQILSQHNYPPADSAAIRSSHGLLGHTRSTFRQVLHPPPLNPAKSPNYKNIVRTLRRTDMSYNYIYAIRAAIRPFWHNDVARQDEIRFFGKTSLFCSPRKSGSTSVYLGAVHQVLAPYLN